MDFNDLKIDQELNYSLSREEVNYFKEDNLADYFNVSYEVAHYRYNYIVNRII